MEPGKYFQKVSDDEESFDTQTYQQAMGCLTYASTAARPDIAAAVGTLSHYMSNPSKDHWMLRESDVDVTGVKRILRCLKGTMNYGLRFSDCENDKIVGFAASGGFTGGAVEGANITMLERNNELWTCEIL